MGRRDRDLEERVKSMEQGTHSRQDLLWAGGSQSRWPGQWERGLDEMTQSWDSVQPSGRNHVVLGSL